MIISAPLREPITWHCSKVETTAPKGIDHLTFAQDRFDQHHDYIEYDEDGVLVGMWADYYKSQITPTPIEDEPEIPEDIETGTIKYSGTTPQIKVGGSYKKFTYEGETLDGIWEFTIDEESAEDLIEISTAGLLAGQIKIKFLGDETYLGKIMDVVYKIDDNIAATCAVEILAL